MDGEIHIGCNVENVAYPEGTCAEAGAIAAMVEGGLQRDGEELVMNDGVGVELLFRRASADTTG